MKRLQLAYLLFRESLRHPFATSRFKWDGKSWIVTREAQR